MHVFSDSCFWRVRLRAWVRANVDGNRGGETLAKSYRNEFFLPDAIRITGGKYGVASNKKIIEAQQKTKM